MEKLKVREQIHFYADILLFEDELGDNGHSMLSVKIVSLTRQTIFLKFYYCALLNHPFPQSLGLLNKVSQMTHFRDF